MSHFLPRRIALQGIGAGAFSIAVQGFAPVDEVIEPPVLYPPYAGSGSSGGRGEMSVADWLRRLEKQAAAAPAATQAEALPEPVSMPAKRTVRRRRREEETLLLLA